MLEVIAGLAIVSLGILAVIGAAWFLIFNLREGDTVGSLLAVAICLVVVLGGCMIALEVKEGDTRVVNGVTEHKQCEQKGYTPIFNGKTTTMVPNYDCKWVAVGPNP